MPHPLQRPCSSPARGAAVAAALSVSLLVLAPAGLGCATAEAQEPPVDQAELLRPKPWPRTHEKGDQKVVVFEPQLDEWIDYRELTVRSALSVVAAKGEEAVYGVVEMKAVTEVDHDTRMVLIKDPVLAFRFPNVDAAKAKGLEAIAREVIPDRKSIPVTLERALSYVDREAGTQREVEVVLDPPPIYYSDKPAVLVLFMGKPQFKPIQGTSLMAAVNTNWDVFLDQKVGQYYLLLDGESWLTTTDPETGPYTPAGATSPEIAKLPADKNWEEARKAYPGKPLAGPAPAVFISTKPAELIQTQGEPKYSPVAGTKLMHVTNTDSVLFLHTDEGNHYFLVAGRWFRSKSLVLGPWTAATKDLPADFAKLPADDEEFGDIRASVPGTEEAEDAILLASVPRTATIQKADLKVEVTYVGEPKFTEIKGTEVKYAVNTPCQVFLVYGKYYCCYEGVWFVSATSGGPWEVCTTVPAPIYTIPASHPTHNVTYVYVYDSSPDTVTCSYTSGYTGQYCSNGVLMFGAGVLVGAAIDDDDDYYPYYPAPYYSYGCGAYYGYGGYYRAGYGYGPYGGAGYSGFYNPYTGAWGRSAYKYGPYGSAYARQGYNPYTNTYGARAGGSNMYGSWGRGYVQRGDDWIKGGHTSGPGGSAGWIQSSSGAGAVRVDGPGGGGTVAKDRYGNVYAGKDGNVYRRDENGNWQQNGGGGWNDVNRPDSPTPRGEGRPGTGEGRPGTGEGRPGTGEGRPGGETLEPRPQPRERPGAGESRPGAGESRPGAGEARPGAGERPSTQPSTRPSTPQRRDVTGSSRYTEKPAQLDRESTARQRSSYSEQRSQRSYRSSSSRSYSGGGGSGRSYGGGGRSSGGGSRGGGGRGGGGRR